MEEIWTKLADCWDREDVKYSEYYLVSSHGNVISHKAKWKNGKNRPPKMLSKHDNSYGYHIVSLNRNKKLKSISVHQAVYYSFNGGCPCGRSLVVDHIDKDKKNNNLNNLRLITHAENVRRSINLSDTATGELNICIRECGKYGIYRQQNRKKRRYGSFKTLEEAVARRDELIKNNWIKQ